jgi:hypothetical protein
MDSNCKPLTGPPPGRLPCRPVLVLGLASYVEIPQILINDLVYAETSTLREKFASLDDDALLKMLQHLSHSDLVQMAEVYGGSVIVKDEDIYAAGTDQVDTALLQRLTENQPRNGYQAIVIDDTSFIREPELAKFVLQHYNKPEDPSSVVIMACEGIFDISLIRQSFGVDWEFSAYTRRAFKLTETGKTIVGTDAFPFDTCYTKGNIIVGQGELVAEHIDPADYEPDPVPLPNPGSPVTTYIEGGAKSVSYFGFVNSLDVSFGAIMFKLCYAAAAQTN